MLLSISFIRCFPIVIIVSIHNNLKVSQMSGKLSSPGREDKIRRMHDTSFYLGSFPMGRVVVYFSIPFVCDVGYVL